MRLQKLLQLHYRLLPYRLLLPLLLAPLLLFFFVAVVVGDGDGFFLENLLVLFAVLNVFREVFVEEYISEDEQYFSDFGCFLPILQNVGHAQIEYFLDVVDRDGDAPQILD